MYHVGNSEDRLLRYDGLNTVLFCMSDFCVSGCADLHLLDMLSPMERKRQGYIHELIVTEENYVNDLQLVTEVNTHDAHPFKLLQ